MGWLSQSVFDEAKARAIALTQAERDALTADDVRRFSVADTIDFAMCSGLIRSVNEGKLTPWQAVARLRGIDPDTPAALAAFDERE